MRDSELAEHAPGAPAAKRCWP